MVEKKIAAETETAKRIILNAAKKKTQLEIDWEDFNQIFCKGIFKEVLIALANKIKQSKTNARNQLDFRRASFDGSS